MNASEHLSRYNYYLVEYEPGRFFPVMSLSAEDREEIEKKGRIITPLVVLTKEDYDLIISDTRSKGYEDGCNNALYEQAMR